jgi:hypothetical protein
VFVNALASQGRDEVRERECLLDEHTKESQGRWSQRKGVDGTSSPNVQKSATAELHTRWAIELELLSDRGLIAPVSDGLHWTSTFKGARTPKGIASMAVVDVDDARRWAREAPAYSFRVGVFGASWCARCMSSVIRLYAHERNTYAWPPYHHRRHP